MTPMTKHLLLAGIALLAHSVKTGRDVHWYVQRKASRQ
jgi:hypothetical protein